MGKVFFVAALTLAAMSLVFAAREKRVWDIPDVPDFSDPRWQTSRSDAQIVGRSPLIVRPAP